MKGRTLTVSYAEPRQADVQQAQAAQAAPEAVKARPAPRPARHARAAAVGRACAAVRRPAPAVLGCPGRPAPRRDSLGSRALRGVRPRARPSACLSQRARARVSRPERARQSVYVGNLPASATEAKLKEVFEGLGSEARSPAPAPACTPHT
jgi:hypothetical protein